MAEEKCRRVLILYSTIDGHTVVICRRLQKILEDAGARVSLFEIGAGTAALLREADQVVIGASIRYGHHRPAVAAFMQEHRSQLESRHCAFFSVNVVARKPNRNQPDTNPYVRKFLRRLGWRPATMAVFAGRIDYPACGPLDRWAIRLIMTLTKGPTDPHGVFEFTDWAQVEAFGRQLASTDPGSP